MAANTKSRAVPSSPQSSWQQTFPAADLPPADFAKASLRAVGIGYLRFARTEPGLFRTAFGTGPQPDGASRAGQAGNTGLNPFQLLSLALDRMEASAVLPAERRVGAEYLAWSAVHGLAMLVLENVIDLGQRRSGLHVLPSRAEILLRSLFSTKRD